MRLMLAAILLIMLATVASGQTILIKRGTQAQISSATLAKGEPAFAYDTGALFIGYSTQRHHKKKFLPQ